MRAFATLLATLGLSLALAGSAGAQDRARHGHDHGGREGGRRESGGHPAFEGRPGERGADGRGFEAPPDMGRPPSGPPADFVPRRYNRPTYPGYAPAYPASPPPLARGGSWRRGEFLPHAYWGGAAIDPHRYRLRSPPPGFAWYGIGRDAYLVQRSTGLILDTAPGFW